MTERLSAEALREHAYLVARGVRAVALVGQCENAPAAMIRAQTILDGGSEVGAIPFVIDRGDGIADLGYAAARWAIDLYRWLVKEAQDTVPNDQRSRILGLLFGYSVDAVRIFDERQSERIFLSLAPSAGSDTR